jgi:Xaa-Pro aminopeptidase
MIFGPAGLDLSNGSPASGDVELKKGMFIRIDGQAKYKGYICNLSRIVGFGEVSDSLAKAHSVEKWLVERCMEEMKPGMKCSDLRQIELDLYDDIGYPPVIPYTGHGVGRVVHEPPYIALNDHTVLQPNMVETLEPTICHSEGEEHPDRLQSSNCVTCGVASIELGGSYSDSFYNEYQEGAGCFDLSDIGLTGDSDYLVRHRPVVI